MVRHIVVWTLKPNAEGADAQTNAQRVKAAFEKLNGRIPGMLRLEIGLDFSRTKESGDVVLYSEFESRAALEGYQEHPEHVALKAFMRTVRDERRVVDYEVG